MNGQLVNFDKLVDGGVNYPQFAMVTLLRLAACSVPLLIGLTSRCFAHRARASCAPRHCHPQFAMVVPRRAQSALAALPCSLGLLRPVSATGGGLRAPPPVSAEILWISGRGNCKEAIFALENGIFRRGVLRVHAPLNSAWSSHCARRLACGTPCFIGLTTACFRHWRRPSCAPAVHAAGDD